MVLHLTVWEKLAMMASGAIIVLIVLIIVVCFVGPGCPGERWLGRRLEKRGKKKETTNEGLPLSNITYQSYQRDSIYGETLGVKNNIVRGSSFRDSSYSSMSGGSTRTSLSALSEQSVITVHDEPVNKKEGGQVIMALQYLTLEESSTNGKLIIEIKSAKGLPNRDYPCSPDPYLLIRALKSATWAPLSRRKRSSIIQFPDFKTRIVRHTTNPEFQQNFSADIHLSELKEWCLFIVAYDLDRYAGPTELGQGKVHLKEAKNIAMGQPITVKCNLHRNNKARGELLFGISFLPTAQRLSFSILRATGLKHNEVTQSLDNFRPYVRVLMLGSSGRIIRKKKTVVVPGTDCPVFNETLIFDASIVQLEGATFLVLLCCEGMPQPCTGSQAYEEATTEEDIQSQLQNSLGKQKRSRDLCLGRLSLGRQVKGAKEKEHWLAAVTCPRKVISHWHTLR